MPALARSEIFDSTRVGIYHCWSQCVRRAFLCGRDSYTGKDYSHRKQWILDGLRELAGKMAIDVLDFAILDNHLHTILRNRPDVVAEWSDEEVARRWLLLCPDRKKSKRLTSEPSQAEINLLKSDPERLAERRSRLSDISWFMRLLTQPVARRANQEDDVRGRFFAKRFDSEPIESIAQLLACSIYVDLNVIRANVALTPETSEYTSAYYRIRGRLRRQQSESGHEDSVCAEDAWLAPIYLDESASAYTDAPSATAANSIFDLAPAARASNKGFLPISLERYLALLDWSGREIRKDKRGAIPPELAPILERLGWNSDVWIESLIEYEPRTRRRSCESDSEPADGVGTFHAPRRSTNGCAAGQGTLEQVIRTRAAPRRPRPRDRDGPTANGRRKL